MISEVESSYAPTGNVLDELKQIVERQDASHPDAASRRKPLVERIAQRMTRFREHPINKVAVYYLLLLVIFIVTREASDLYLKHYSFPEFARLSKFLSEELKLTLRLDQISVTIISLFQAFLYAIPAAWVYVITKREDGYDESNMQSIIVIALLVTGLMMVIQDSLARAFGLVGVVSAVRFRTTMKDSKDAVFIFLGIGIGMACGLGVPHIAAALSLVVNIVLLLLWKFKLGNVVQKTSGEQSSRSIESKDRALLPMTAFGNLSDEKQEEIAQREVEHYEQLRLLSENIAERKKGKRADVVIRIVATQLQETQPRIEAILLPYTRVCEVASISARNDRSAVIEFLVRLNKDVRVGDVLQAILHEASALVQSVEFRRLHFTSKTNKQMRSEKRTSDDPPPQEQPKQNE